MLAARLKERGGGMGRLGRWRLGGKLPQGDEIQGRAPFMFLWNFTPS